MCSTCFPRSSLPADASLPSTGSSGASSPASSVLSKRYDFLPSIPPHFVSFAWRYLHGHSFFSLPSRRVRCRGLELLSRYLRPGVCRGNDRISQVPGEPRLSVRSCSVDAGRTAGTRSLRCRSVAPGIRKARAAAKGLSTLNSMAFGLAVYASQCGSPTPHARLASGRWSGATGRAFHPQGSTERFQSSLLHLIPLSQASCRNRIDRRIPEVTSAFAALLYACHPRLVNGHVSGRLMLSSVILDRFESSVYSGRSGIISMYGINRVKCVGFSDFSTSAAVRV